MKNIKSLHKQRFGRLTVFEYVGPRKHPSGQKSHMWLCFCDCGQPTVVRSSDLRSGNTRSCGCLEKELAKQRMTTHGHASNGKDTPEYRAWCAAKNRCRNTKDAAYSNYGGRGIECRFETFAEFLDAVGLRPSDKHSLDRYPDNDGHYEKGNVRWATRTEQNSNRRKPRKALEKFSCEELLRELTRRGYHVGESFLE